MKRFIVLVLALAALGFVPQASAYHHFSDLAHWSTDTVQVNGGGCSSVAQQCRFIQFHDHTGYGNTWRTNAFYPAMEKIAAAGAGRLQLSYRLGLPRFDVWTIDPNETNPCTGVCDGTYHWSEAFEMTDYGDVFIGRNCAQAAVNSSSSHIQEVIVCVDNNKLETLLHELGHSVGLNHRKIDMSGNCDSATSVMCALGEAPWNRFDSHDVQELSFLHGHSD